MAVLFTDLDRTLIYSHRHEAPQGAVWVETLRGKKQSFMTAETYRFFQTQRRLEVVPLTTRTIEQYQRLSSMAAAFSWRRALLCNGAILLEDGQEDPAWSEASRALSAADRPALEEALAWAAAGAGMEAVVSVPPFLFYVKTDDPEAFHASLAKRADLSHLSLFRDARKVYCIPRSLNKGAAAERYLRIFGGSPSYAAGDSAFDLPMLEAAERCFCPRSLAGQVGNPGKIVCPDGLFSDSICRRLDLLRKEEAY